MSLITLGLATDYLTEAGLSATAPITSATRPFFWQQMERTRANFAEVLDNLAAIKHARLALTNAQIKALADSTLPIVTAAGSGITIYPLWARILVNATAGAYTGMDAASTITIQHNGAPFPLMSFVPNDAAITNGAGGTRVSDLLGSAARKHVILIPFNDTENVNEWGPIPHADVTANGENKALEINFDNNGSGVLGGGHVNNTGQVDVLYLQL